MVNRGWTLGVREGFWKKSGEDPSTTDKMRREGADALCGDLDWRVDVVGLHRD